MAAQTRSENQLNPPPESARFSNVRLLLIAAVLMVGTTVGIWLGQTKIVDGFESGHLEVPPEALDFGTVWSEDGFEWVLPIHNPTAADIDVVDFRLSCRCMAADHKAMVIPAGQTRELKLKLDLTSEQRDGGKLESQPFNVSVAPVISGGLSNITGWTIQGRVRDAFTITPSTLSSDGLLIAGRPFPPLRAEIKSHVALTRLTAECDQPGLASASIRELEPKRYELEVIPQAGTPVGDYALKVSLKGDAPGEAPPISSVPVVMQVLDFAGANPAQVVFGSVRLGESRDEIISVFARTEERLSVTDIAVPPDCGLEVTRLGVADDGLFEVRQLSKSLNEQSANVDFMVQSSSSKKSTRIRVPVSYFGSRHPGME